MSRRRAAEVAAIASVLAGHGFDSPDEIRHHDIDAAADVAGVARPETRDERFAVASAYTRLTEG